MEPALNLIQGTVRVAKPALNFGPTACPELDSEPAPGLIRGSSPHLTLIVPRKRRIDQWARVITTRGDRVKLLKKPYALLIIPLWTTWVMNLAMN